VGVYEWGDRWPLTGREAELQACTAAWADRHCRVLVIVGPAGVGKTRLAEECLARAAREGWKGGRATASAAARTVPLGAIAHLIPAGVELSDPVKGFAQVATALAGPQRNRRWVVWVDDLHLLDATSAVLLRQLLDAGVVRLIGTVRAGEPVGDAVAALTTGSAVYRIDLTAFGERQVEAVLRAALGAPVGRRTLHELYTASGGNVLYLRELVLGALEHKTLASDGEIWELAEGALPTTPKLTEVIGARLEAAGPVARPVLDLLSLCEPVPLADAQALAPLDVLAGLEGTGLVRVVTDRRRTLLTLAHPLYGEMLRAGLSTPRRCDLLLQQVERVESRGANRREDALHTASWRLAATGTADPAMLIRAATLARHAHDYRQVVALLLAVPEQHHSTMTRVVLSEALWELGEPKRAEKVLLVAEAHAQGEQEQLAVTITHSVNWFWGSSRADQALAVIESAARQMHSSDSHRVLRIVEGWIRTVSGQPAEGLALLEELDADAHQTPDINAWLWGAIMKTTGLALVGRAVEGVAFAEHAHTTHMRLDEEAVVPHPSTQLLVKVIALAEAGCLAEARAVGERAFNDLVAARAPMPRVWMAFHLGRTEYLAGHPAAARHWYAEAATWDSWQARNNWPRPGCTQRRDDSSRPDPYLPKPQPPPDAPATQPQKR